jgi:hypothetical protein
MAEEYLSNIQQNQLLAIHALNKVAYKTEVLASTWKIGQLVWLEGRNLPLPYGTVKLALQWHSPFKITKIISPLAIRLKLPAQWSIHPHNLNDWAVNSEIKQYHHWCLTTELEEVQAKLGLVEDTLFTLHYHMKAAQLSAHLANLKGWAFP